MSDLPRGAMVASPGMVTTTDTIDVSVHMDVDVGARLRSGAHVRLMVGAADVAARIRLLHAAELSPGEGGFGRLLTDQPIPVRPGARFVLRRPSPPLTLGGGTLLDVPDTQARGLRRGDLGALARLSALAAGDGVGAARASLADAGLKGCSAADIARWAGPGPRAGDLSALQLRSGRWVSEAAVRGLAQRLASGTTPVDLPALAAREVAPADVLEAAAAWLVALGRHRLVDGQLHEADPGSDGALDTALEADFRAAGLASLPLATVVGGEPARAAAVGRLLKAQRLVRLRHAQGRHPIVLHATVLADAEARLRSVWADGGTFTVAAVRDAFGLTRRDILPLLEHFDATGVTARRGEVRQLRGGHTVSGGD